ncbi:hypothetical protein QE152_g34801 [Popillia japonica]|uniref:Uncharacterized protein n=1 Tax=Popillia japonica TaxID=7064 RepID=A0AAW1ISS3_POPJA
MRYEYQVYYSPGNNLVVADALSRDFSDCSDIQQDAELTEDTEANVNFIVNSLAVKPYLLDEIKMKQSEDPICKKLIEYSLTRWPDRNLISHELLPYYQYRFEMSFSEGFLLRFTYNDTTMFTT